MVVAPRLQHRRAVRAVPAVLAAAGPDAVLSVRVASPSVAAVPGAAWQRAVSSVPARHAHTGPVLALSVFAAPVDGKAGVTVAGLSSFSSSFTVLSFFPSFFTIFYFSFYYGGVSLLHEGYVMQMW